jgi:hypothetical protein
LCDGRIGAILLPGSGCTELGVRPMAALMRWVDEKPHRILFVAAVHTAVFVLLIVLPLARLFFTDGERVP